VYIGTNLFNSTRTRHYRFYFSWETSLPFIPPFIIVYFSAFFSFIIPACFLERDKINLLGGRYIFIILFSGIIFLIFPTRLGFFRPEPVELFEKIYRALYMVDKPYNMFPSLHIGYSAATMFSFLDTKLRPLKWFLAVWLILITISVVVIHQHHLADIAGGYAVALLSMVVIRPESIGKINR
jgi:membrane-associated phospholipid phosphatase